MEATLAAKRTTLETSLGALGRVVVAYSGGVDSTFLAAVAAGVLGSDSLAITAVSPSLARRELAACTAQAAALGLRHRVVDTHEVTREEYARNDPDRCYWCKAELFDVLAPIATELDAAICVGTNLDDLSDHRPGQRAARERDVHAPLVDARLTKTDIRALAASMGLPSASKPASPCLASRFAYGVRVTPEGLRRVDRAEEVLHALSFTTFRVRDHGDLARIEVSPAEIERAASLRDEIAIALEGLGFRYVTLDLTGFRSGSMNEVLGPPSIRTRDEDGGT